ncbi:endonuclease/exonuclease/phosphatase family protein [Palleronia sp.]|uniref:endonuclease/exonuclease/phosphatase family protein n=1 Tax=Palleronia sp. TaxID=1940284 RepID=UPI0035C83298
MTRRAFALLLLVLAACSRGPANLPPAPEGSLRVASHNVHYIDLNAQSGDWSAADWEVRKPALDAAFKALDADIVAFQEMESFSRGSDGGTNLARDWLLSRNPQYRAAAVGDWRAFPSTQPIFYRHDRLTVVEQGWYFFSKAPDVIYSRSFDGAYPAFASWARFKDDKGRIIHVTNVHLDAFSTANRQGATDLIVSRLRPVLGAGETAFLVGDLNAIWLMGPVRQLKAAGLTFADIRGATYHFDRGLGLFGAIDHIAYSGARVVQGPYVLRGRFDGEWPSDHYPIAVDLAY